MSGPAYKPPPTSPQVPTFTITNSADNLHLSVYVSRYLNQIRTENHRPIITPHLNLSAVSTPSPILKLHSRTDSKRWISVARGGRIEISYTPNYPHRGLMIDTSRNFYSVEDILRTIRGMSQNKMNVFHWHISDSHSFPIVMSSETDLAERGGKPDTIETGFIEEKCGLMGRAVT